MNKEQVASQTKWHSWIETCVNTAVGYVINVTAQHYLFPVIGIHISVGANLMIGLIFTVISIVRSFTLRRIFNWWHVRRVTTII